MSRRGIVVATVLPLLLGSLIGSARAQDDPQATIEALQTQVAELTTPTPTPRQRTPLPSTSRLTPTPEANSDLPPAVAEIARQDSSTGCDETGWGISSSDDLTSEQSSHHAACVGGAAYIVACIDVTQSADGGFFSPPSGSLWLGCLVRVINGGSDDVNVNPLYFSLVTADGRRETIDFEPMMALSDLDMLDAGSVPPDQYVEGFLFFTLDRDDEPPFRIEIEPLTFSLDDQKPGIVIIDELLDPSD